MSELTPGYNPNYLSEIHLQQLQRVSADLHRNFPYRDGNLPAYLGMTAFGSLARGESTADSDIDLYAYFEADPELQSGTYYRVDLGGEGISGSYMFKPMLENWIQNTIRVSGERARLPKLDAFIAPINEKIVYEQCFEILKVAKAFDDAETSKAYAPRNVRGLFHLPVDVQQLNGFAVQAISQLDAFKQSQTAWNMIRHLVVGYEQGRNGDYTGEHRNIPSTLEEARRLYL